MPDPVLILQTTVVLRIPCAIAVAIAGDGIFISMPSIVLSTRP